MVQVQQGTIFRVTTSSSFSYTSNQVLTLFSIPAGYTLPAVGASPAGSLHAPVHITLFNSSNVITNTYPAILEVNGATIVLRNLSSTTITIGVTDYLQIAIGGISWYGI
jgi:hypothetical protein